ncbi:MAG: cardiolipin synthase [Lachnospiraceae bacterium]|jgi:cardiolipin synthase
MSDPNMSGNSPDRSAQQRKPLHRGWKKKTWSRQAPKKAAGDPAQIREEVDHTVQASGGKPSDRITVVQKAETRNSILRVVFAIISISLQIALIVVAFSYLNANEWMSLITRLLAFVLVIAINSQYKTVSMRTPWIVLIMFYPVAGVTFYLMVGLSGATRTMRKRYSSVDADIFPMIPQERGPVLEEERENWDAASISKYISARSKYPVYRNSDVRYFGDTNQALDAQVEAARKASRFIFMEYYAIEDKESFHRILEVLVEKAAEGVEVRIFYDDLGSSGFINTDFIDKMRRLGIRCRVFNPMGPIVNVFLNNRDHRKIMIVDGETAFTGGYNLANEYFNITHPYGRWKDSGVQVTGEAVKNFTAMFLEMWNAVRSDDRDDRNYGKYFPEIHYESAEKGFVQPYADTPIDHEPVGENVYISMVEKAKKYVWFITPYLIITEEMIHTLGLAAKRGVDVRIVTPGIPDKKIIYSVTRSYYNTLTRNGVRIYEYTPGFCHSKVCVCDDRMAVCGTINLDYRSFYHHFEDACFFTDCSAVLDVRRDIESVIRDSRDVTEYYTTGRGALMRAGQAVLRMFATLL